MGRPRRERLRPGGAFGGDLMSKLIDVSLFGMMAQPMMQQVWGQLQASIREAGAEIFKNPRAMAEALRQAAAFLDRYAADQEAQKKGKG